MPFQDLIGDPEESQLAGQNARRKQERDTHIHQPIAMWIGCCDARVVPEYITGDSPGELFVVRNVANIVPPFGTVNDSIGAAIEFAVLGLHVSHIVICGHTDCGGIRALEGAVELATMPALARWVEWARPAQHQVLVAGSPDDHRHIAAVQSNILLQRQNLLSYSYVSEAVDSGTLKLHAWLFETLTNSLIIYNDDSGVWSKMSDID